MGKKAGKRKGKDKSFLIPFLSGIGSGDWRYYVIRNRGNAGLDDSPENNWFSFSFSET